MRIDKVQYRFEKKLTDIITTNDLIRSGAVVMVAFSGGKDSVSLLYALKNISEKLSFSVIAAHINHGIRTTADRDLCFASDFCKKNKIEFYSDKADIPQISKTLGKGIEETAREVRYELLQNLAKSVRAELIATAHNMNDNAETVLFNIARGTGLNGVSGILEKRDNIIRPLLGFTRAEIEDYVNCCGLENVEDETNEDTDYIRNYIRHKIMPLFDKVNPNIVKNIYRLSQTAKQDTDLLDLLAKEGQSVDVNDHSSIKARKIANDFFVLNGKSLEKTHIDSVLEAVAKSKCSKKQLYISLPGDFEAVISDGNYKIIKTETKTYSEAIPALVELKQGFNDFGSWRVFIGENKPEKTDDCAYNEEIIYNYLTLCALDFDKISKCVYARNRRQSDCFICNGINRNIKKCFIDKKIPLEERDKIPVICDNEGIIFVPYIGIADRVYTKSPKKALWLYVSYATHGKR